MVEHFYDRVTRKFGTFQSFPHPQTNYPQGNPEEIFALKLLEVSGQDKVALDLGCGDGLFTLRMAPNFKEIVGIDGSVVRLELAGAEAQKRGISSARFEMQNAHQTTFADSSFDVVYSRRGPSPYSECRRILKPEGHFVIIGIGEKDTWVLKEVFGRGQGFHAWETSALQQAVKHWQQAGFQIVYGQDFFYDEYYASYDDLDVFLQGVPIFEDFDSEKDRDALQTYVAQAQREKGILLPRHRFVLVATRA